MTALYDVFFTTKQKVVKYDESGDPKSSSMVELPVSHKSLTSEQADAYDTKDAIGFKKTEVGSNPAPIRTKPLPSDTNHWARPATKDADRLKYRKQADRRTKSPLKTTVKKARRSMSPIGKAAQTGNLGAAIND